MDTSRAVNWKTIHDLFMNSDFTNQKWQFHWTVHKPFMNSTWICLHELSMRQSWKGVKYQIARHQPGYRSVSRRLLVEEIIISCHCLNQVTSTTVTWPNMFILQGELVLSRWWHLISCAVIFYWRGTIVGLWPCSLKDIFITVCTEYYAEHAVLSLHIVVTLQLYLLLWYFLKCMVDSNVLWIVIKITV